MRSFAVAVFCFVMCLPALTQAAQEGLYRIQGRNSQFGEYSGQGWIRAGQAQRLIRWSTYRSAGHQVETVWSGAASTDRLEFSLALSNLLTRFESFEPSTEAIRTPITVSVPFSNPASLTYAVPSEGTYTESWVRLTDAPLAPLWKDLRQAVVGVGEREPAAIRLARWAGIDMVIDWYRVQPGVDAYRHRTEYQEQKQYFIQDRTDADFYAQNANVLRVTNKTLNPLALAEAQMRRNAYAPPLHQKAELFTKQTLSYNLNAAGLLDVAVVNERKEKVGRYPEHDSALWTAMLGWAQAMRYEVTKDPEAAATFRKILEGTLTLVEISDDPKDFARTLEISPPEEVLGEGWVQGVGKNAHLKWRRGGNNDMFKGVLMTLALAHRFVGPEEHALRARILNASLALLKTSAVSGKSDNRGLAHGLVALWSKDEYELNVFSSNLNNIITVIADVSEVNNGFYVGGIADWSGVHLSAITTMVQILLSQELLKVFPYHPYGYKALATLRSAESTLFKMQKTYRTAQRHFLTLLAYAYSPKARKDGAFRAEAEEALWTLKEVPFPRSIGNAAVDLTKHAHWSLSAWPHLPWKGLIGVRKMKDTLDFDYFATGAYGYPLFEGNAWATTYLWKDTPFRIRYVSHASVLPFSADYLMVYWAARSSGLISAQH